MARQVHGTSLASDVPREVRGVFWVDKEGVFVVQANQHFGVNTQ